MALEAVQARTNKSTFEAIVRQDDLVMQQAMALCRDLNLLMPIELWSHLFKTVSYPILEYTLLVALNDTLGGFILP